MPSKSARNNFTFAYQDKYLHTNSSRNTHIRKLNDLLHSSIERNDIPRALRAWSILARCKEFDWRRDWRTAFLLLKSASNSTQSPNERTTSFLRRTMRAYPEEAESILQEIVLNMAESELFKEALDELELYLPAFPYQDNAVLHCYAGLMSLHLSQSTTEESGRREYRRKTSDYFDKALLIDPENAVAEAFKKEILTRGAQTDGPAERLSPSIMSDEEMDDGVDRTDRKYRPKRLRNDRVDDFS